MKFLALLLLLAAPCVAQTSDRLLDALERVESNGNARAVGDNGRALGCLQIWSSVVADVNRLTGSCYRHADAFDRATARDIARAYLNHYASPKRIGRPVTDQDRARIWNGGPTGHRKAATTGYWSKVRRALAKA